MSLATAKRRLQELSELKQGWYDGEQGDPINSTVLNNTRKLLEQLPTEMHTLAVTAAVDGGIDITTFLPATETNPVQVKSFSLLDDNSVILVTAGCSKELDFEKDFAEILKFISE